MGQKKKTTSARLAKSAKAGSHRAPYKPVTRERVIRKRNGEKITVTEENPSHIRRGLGSNREEAYTGYPTSYYR